MAFDGLMGSRGVQETAVGEKIPCMAVVSVENLVSFFLCGIGSAKY
jgi:hypothetical protein